jgi:hypothetical protein
MERIPDSMLTDETTPLITDRQSLEFALERGLTLHEARPYWYLKNTSGAMEKLVDRALAQAYVEQPPSGTLTCEGCGRRVGALWNNLCVSCVFLGE